MCRFCDQCSLSFTKLHRVELIKRLTCVVLDCT